MALVTSSEGRTKRVPYCIAPFPGAIRDPDESLLTEHQSPSLAEARKRFERFKREFHEAQGEHVEGDARAVHIRQEDKQNADTFIEEGKDRFLRLMADVMDGNKTLTSATLRKYHLAHVIRVMPIRKYLLDNPHPSKAELINYFYKYNIHGRR